jgi:hypothetical protein
LLFGALLLVGTSPFGVHGIGGEPRAAAFATVALNVVLAVIVFLKGKLTTGMLAVFVPLVGLFGSLRLAKPRSLWSKWFYGEAKRTRAEHRFEHEHSLVVRAHRRFDDLLGGAPTFMAPLGMEIAGGRLRVPESDSRRGQGEGDPRAASRTVLGPDAPALRLDQPARDRQPQPGAA